MNSIKDVIHFFTLFHFTEVYLWVFEKILKLPGEGGNPYKYR